ncbi:hypothetical protein E8E14_002871 [Neopestalotiopsis sp. 37M]|nr:hypothetical protein E8E14_002871 [Neopestalotiopsis sp. 37M]
MGSLPESMEALALFEYGQPAVYQKTSLKTPAITQANEVLIKVHATSINPIDVKMASGVAKRIQPALFPYKLGFDVAGTIVAIGATVTTLKIGDEVYSRVPNPYRGTVADYALSTEEATAIKPASLGFEDAASIPLAGLTSLQCMEYANEHLSGGLEGKTVFIPAGLSGTGSFAVQLARNIFKAGRVITTVSTKKISKAEEFLGPGVELVDYTKEDVAKRIGCGTVDYFFDTMGETTMHLPIMKQGGVISGADVKKYLTGKVD